MNNVKKIILKPSKPGNYIATVAMMRDGHISHVDIDKRYAVNYVAIALTQIQIGDPVLVTLTHCGHVVVNQHLFVPGQQNHIHLEANSICLTALNDVRVLGRTIWLN